MQIERKIIKPLDEFAELQLILHENTAKCPETVYEIRIKFKYVHQNILVIS